MLFIHLYHLVCTLVRLTLVLLKANWHWQLIWSELQHLWLSTDTLQVSSCGSSSTVLVSLNCSMFMRKRVCKEMFWSTLSLGEWSVRNWVEGTYSGLQREATVKHAVRPKKKESDEHKFIGIFWHFLRWNLTTAVHQVQSCILSPSGPHMLLCIKSM